jgi:cobalt-zinc-cadmium efflux system outer membrane protein
VLAPAAFVVLVLPYLAASEAISTAAPAPPESQNAPQVLSLDRALALFHERGFDLLLAEAATESARADLIIASAIPNPSANAALLKGFNCGMSDCSFGLSVGLSDQAAFEDSLSGKRSLRMSIGQAAYEAARLSRRDAERVLEFAVKQQYTQAALSKSLLDFAIEALKYNTDTLTLNQIKYKAGAISEADLAKTETAKLEADQAVDTARLGVRASRIALGFLLGYRTAVPDFEVDTNVLHTPIPKDVAGVPRDELIQRAFKKRPDLAANLRQQERAQGSVSLAKRQRFPDIALSASYAEQGFSNSAVTPPTLTIGLSAPLPVLYQQQGEIAKSEVEVKTQVITGEKLQAQIVADIDSAFASLNAAKSLVDRMESVLLERATRQRDLVAIQYNKGAASLLELLDAQRQYVATRVEYYQDLALYRVALSQLEQALGGSF